MKNSELNQAKIDGKKEEQQKKKTFTRILPGSLIIGRKLLSHNKGGKKNIKLD